MSIAADGTQALWQQFMPFRSMIANRMDEDHYSVEIYGSTAFFNTFDPFAKFEKWAAVRVSEFGSVPDGMESLLIPGGPYAVFRYKGVAGEAAEAYRYIYGAWLPRSGYELADRPHFAIMGADYRAEDPESEETIWIPVRKP